jgi:hypothetical protein
MAKYYAWSTFPQKLDAAGKIEKAVQVGEEVSADKIKVSKEEFDYLLETGAVREEPYPDISPQLSPAEHFRAQESTGMTEELSAGERKELLAFREAQAAKASSATGVNQP